jgi:peroxiredoxin
LVYRGTFTEEATGSRVQFNRAYRVEVRAFVLDAPPRGAEVALLTVLKSRDPNPKTPAVGADASTCSVRLERATVDLQGKLTTDPGVSLAVPLEGAPTLECGLFVEVPGGRIGAGQSWEVTEADRPKRTWRVAGTDTVNGTSCLKLVGLQQTDDWDRPRADRAAWRRQDTVWLSPRAGIAYRVERVIERREPARRVPTQRSVLRYEMESSLQYPGSLFDDRRLEITQARSFRDSAAPMLPSPAKFGPQLATLLNKINYHLEHQTPTPYREAVLQVKRRVEAARRGETPPAAADEGRPAGGGVANLGEKAPDFAAPLFTGTGTASLRRWQGKPVVLVFYSPTSQTTPDLLRFAQELSTSFQGLTVLGLALSDNAAQVQKQRDDLKLTFPLLNGSGLRVSYAVETTPKVMLLDAAGIVRGAFLGWGRETPAEIIQEVRRWAK